MARHQDRPSGTRRPPALPALAPPRAKPQSPANDRRSFAPLPQLASQDSDPFAPKSRNGEFYRHSQQRMGQRRNAPNLKLAQPAPQRSSRPQHATGPRLGKGAHKHSRRKRKYRVNPSFTKALTILASIILICAIAFMGARYVFAYNALEVLLNGRHIGYMSLNRELTSAQFHDEVIAYIESGGHGGRIEIIPTDRVEIAIARRVPNRNMSDPSLIKNDIARSMNYQIVARAIYIQGTRRAVVRSQEYIDDMQEDIKRRHRNEHTVSEHFLVEWQVQNVTLEREYYGFQSPQDALRDLDHNVNYDIMYTVLPGDNKTLIAARFDGVSADRIAQVNNRLVTDMLHPGEQLIIRTTVPLLTVVYVDEFTEDTIIPAPVEERDNDLILENERVTYQEGRDGITRSTRRVIRHNGVVVSTEELAAEVIQEPLTHIIEVGTRPGLILR